MDAAKAARQRGPTVYPATVFVKLLLLQSTHQLSLPVQTREGVIYRRSFLFLEIGGRNLQLSEGGQLQLEVGGDFLEFFRLF